MYSEKNTPVVLPVHKNGVRQGADSQIRIGVLVQVHVACQRVAKQLDSWPSRHDLKKTRHCDWSSFFCQEFTSLCPIKI